MRDYLLELRDIVIEIAEYSLCFFRTCCLCVFLNDSFELGDILVIRYSFKRYKSLVKTSLQVVLLIENICDAARHSCGEVLACSSENYCTSARHVLTAVVACALADCDCT